MTEREKFEAWLEDNPYRGQLYPAATWAAWQAALAQRDAQPTPPQSGWKPCFNCSCDSTGKWTHSFGCQNDPATFKGAQQSERPSTPVGWSDTDWLAYLRTKDPVAWACLDTLYGTSPQGYLRICKPTDGNAFPLYRHPAQPAAQPPFPHCQHCGSSAWVCSVCAQQPAAQRKPLSDDQIRRIQAAHPVENDPMPFARAIEAAHGIKP